jgi:hypothetical protein
MTTEAGSGTTGAAINALKLPGPELTVGAEYAKSDKL